MNQEHIVIIGNGIAGVTLARHIRKNSNKRITLISAESEHFFSRTALMYVYMGHMKWNHLKPYEDHFWKKNRIELKKAYVEEVQTQNNQLLLNSGETFQYDKLVIATGSKPNKFGWPGQDLPQVQGLYSKQDLEKLEKNAPNNQICKRAVIVGGGLIGIELAEMLRTRNIPVTFLVREKSFWSNVLPLEESEMLNKHILEHGIDLRLNTNLKSIEADKHGNVKSIIIEETGEQIDCNVVGLTAGVSPNIDFLKNSSIETNHGVLVNQNLQTNIQHIYAIGDCAEQRNPTGNRPPIEAVWYTGRMMGETLAQSLTGNPSNYKPGNWFNSAKFFDVEYQTYGWVFPKPKKGHSDFYWKATIENKCIHMHFETESRKFTGINTFGIRMRHEKFDAWLNQEKSIDYVIEHLKEANFDPEFFKKYENEIFDVYKKKLLN
ncbi:NAD(P)/FAD-dependent oxidoreductase [Psychroflexus salis]|uniref:FAD-dependent oxidoreductase n=1 Tax=Psychroflexus salis TaxID=1526574 RepID=A0A916ZQL7_9FLAO|nr:FAD/NAD(P)-binding oxidoreductase [Psychroflexus salis]GGE09365.1 FAD-dependent oxidoreductase [Psychroflexus salis]